MKVLMLMIVLMTTLMTGCSPSCEERGGTLRFSHMNMIPVSNGRGGFSYIYSPVYRCVGAVE